MRAAHFTVIRVGESVWSTWEPRDGQFDLDWLQPVLDGAHARGIDVILGTPTYAVPPWLSTEWQRYEDKLLDIQIGKGNVPGLPAGTARDRTPILIHMTNTLLGPRGLMPSPKTGTVGVNVKEILAELKAGKITYRVDKGSNVQALVGKISFTAEALEENIQALIRSVVKAKPQTSKGTYIKSITISSTMSPGLPVELSVARV